MRKPLLLMLVLLGACAENYNLSPKERQALQVCVRLYKLAQTKGDTLIVHSLGVHIGDRYYACRDYMGR